MMPTAIFDAVILDAQTDVPPRRRRPTKFDLAFARADVRRAGEIREHAIVGIGGCTTVLLEGE